MTEAHPLSLNGGGVVTHVIPGGGIERGGGKGSPPSPPPIETQNITAPISLNGGSRGGLYFPARGEIL